MRQYIKHGLRCKYIVYKCTKCGNKVSRGISKLCRKCYETSLKGSGNPNYGKGRGKKKFYCIDCNKEVSGKIYKRCHSCACKYIWQSSEKMRNRDMCGEKNPNYISGLSNKPYPLEFNDTLKKQIRQRDTFKCQNCDMTEEEHIISMGTVLIVHHIDYDKQNCKKENLIALCNQCNIRANYNREHWESFYKEKNNVQAN